ncbi:MAG: HD family phosphohydrolase [Nitrospinae bacterium CG11_big_fil_rev_8_21_14_0_20_56_8]|nr:MAG: HD family phosphohydrolase [Nitrospinae bacterium CG11_big_fil_rev_8_21_14_0_20_56_8]
MSALKLDQLIRGVTVSAPEVYQKLTRALEDPDSNYLDLGNIISADPGLSARLLKLVNSPFYGFTSHVSSITHAIDIVGTSQLVDLALATEIVDKFNDIPRDLVDMRSFWKHSIGCGILARGFAQKTGQLNPEKYYLAGLLHDIGSVLLYHQSPKMARLVLETSRTNNQLLCDSEKELLGFDHGEIGRALFEKWFLPEVFAEVAESHHHPERAVQHSFFVLIVHIADVICNEMGWGTGGEPQPPPLYKDALVNAGINPADVETIKKSCQSQFNAVVNIFL